MEGILVEVVGAGNVGVLAQALDALGAAWDKLDKTGEVFEAVSAILKAGDDGAAIDAETLAKAARDALIDLVVNQIAKAAPGFIIKKLNPQGAILSTIYSGITWLIDNSAKLGNLLEQGQVIFAAIGELTAAADPATVAARRKVLADAVETLLDKSVVPILSFVASQLGLGDLPDRVAGTLKKLQDTPRAKVVAALTKVKGKALGALGGVAGDARYDGLVGPVVTFVASGETHQYWVVNRGGQAIAMRASSPTPRATARDLVKGLVGERLATDTELTDIDKLLVGDLKLAANQIKDGNILEVKTSTKAELAAARKRIADRAGKLKPDEQAVVDAVVAATKTYYTQEKEDSVYANVTVTDWSGYLKGLNNGKDGLNETRHEHRETVARGGEANGTTFRADHAHHIVMKQGDERGTGATSSKMYSFLSRSILWKANEELANAAKPDTNALNPFLGLWNFAWAPNWGHSVKYAEDVLKRLKEVKNASAPRVHNVLKEIARLQISGHWYVGGKGEGD